MPNHVTHRMVVRGPEKDVKAFVARCIKTEKNDRGATETGFDFNSLIPMPAELNVEAGSCGEIGYEAWYGEWKHMLDYPWVKKPLEKKGITNATREDVQNVLREQSPEFERAGKIYHENLVKYGFTDWYPWCRKNWGTKWNSYSFHLVSQSKRKYEFKFDTAWSPPRPVFEKAASEFPKLRFEIESYDEGGNFACRGAYWTKNGEVESDYGTAEQPEYAEIRRSVYGEDDDDGDEANE